MPIVHIMIALVFIIMISLFYGGLKDIKHGMKSAGSWIFLMAILTVAYRMAQGYALTIEGSKVALVGAVKRTSALLATFFGGELFHEQNLIQKTIACSVMVAGVILIII